MQSLSDFIGLFCRTDHSLLARLIGIWAPVWLFR